MNIVMSALLKGVAFGITMAAVPGPIFFLIIQRTMAEGLLTGLFCGLGAISADALYALLAAIGLTFIMKFLLAYQNVFAILGGGFLIYLGITTIFRKVKFDVGAVRDSSLFSSWLSTLLLTLANPVTMLSYCVIFSALGVGADEQISTVLSLVGGVILGALAVVLLLILFLSFFRKKMTPKALNRLNKVAGFILAGFGVVALMQGIFQFGSSCQVL